jgi:hydroxymethylbilane synthase
LHKRLQVIHDLSTASCINAERAFNRALEGGCHTPIGGFAIEQQEMLIMHGFLGDSQNKIALKASCIGLSSEAEQIGVTLAQRLKAKWSTPS